MPNPAVWLARSAYVVGLGCTKARQTEERHVTAHPSVAHIRELPASLEGSVTDDLIDENGHMNVRHYFNLQELAGVAMFNQLGVDESYPARTGFGVFTLEQHVTYLSECLPNEKFSVHLRLVALSDKTMHTIGYL